MLAAPARAPPALRRRADRRSTIDLIAKSAPLHDIGKVGIPDHILLKPGKLDAAEWEIMKTHAAPRRRRASSRPSATPSAASPSSTVAKQIARYHHERWDGSGYPDGLAGDAIPLAARLMALADVFDALISRRVYKEPFRPAEAREIIAARARPRTSTPTSPTRSCATSTRFCAIADRYADDDAEIAAKRAASGPPRQN